MIDSATLNHAARVLGETKPDFPADAALRRYLGLARHLGQREKRAISQAVFAYFRWLQWLEPRESVQKQVEHAATLQDRFNRDPKSVKPEALAARAVPGWLREEMELPAGYAPQLQHEPSLWLRARRGTATSLANQLGHCLPAPVFEVRGGELHARTSATPVPAATTAGENAPETAPEPSSVASAAVAAVDALRYAGHQDLFTTAAFHAGAFEIQDLASQLVGIATAPQPRQTWWDACAGDGGKLLHLADLMDNKGLIWASDRNTRRLETLKRRAARAHVFNFRTVLWDGGTRPPTKTRFDGVLVDAPCSGVGTWQRNPHARWTTTLDDVRELAVLQLELLNHVADSLKPDGRLVYSVCTLTRSETTGVADAFQAAHPEMEPLPLLGDATRITLWPHVLDANGMFLAGWRKRK